MSTAIGIFSGLFLLLAAIAMKGSFLAFVDPEAAMITIGGTLAATLISFPMPRFLNIFKLFLRLFRLDTKPILENTISRLVELAHKATEHTIFGLEKDSKEETDHHLRMGLQMLVRGASPQQIAHRFAVELDGVKSRHQEGIQMFGFMSRAAPSFGLLGTLIGLVNTLKATGGAISPESLGPNMALALVTTIYGCFMAFFLFLPASEKLKAYSMQEQSVIRVIREAILLIKEGMPSREIEEILNAYLPVRRRKSLVEKLMLSKANQGAPKAAR